ncbi:MAG: LLM class flavin-dependent oxidoreductase [Hyphomicrobiaceae bacterium]|nr:LLM class flavin-dependent oxidoreductase [Hyphomicrobiaceae bacterium]
MPNRKRHMHLAVFWLGTGNHIAGWRMPGAFDSNCSWAIAEAGARIAERGKFDLFFIADSLVSAPNDHPSMQTRLEPTTTVAALSLAARRIGFGCTVSTSFSEPFNVARIFQSLAHLSQGRVAWNVVTSNSPDAYLNFSRSANVEHDRRYEIAEEYVDVVRGLWRGWEAGAVVRNRETGEYVDRTKVHSLDHKGRYFQVRGPLNMERPATGEPLLIQAGGSDPGQELSARVADIVFSVVNGDKHEAKAAYDGLKARLPKYGRAPEDLVLMPGVMPIIGRTEAEAKSQLDRLQGWVSPTNALRLVSVRLGLDLSGYPLDAPVPELPPDANSQSFARTLFAMARRQNMTLRDLYNIAAAARGHWVLCGTATSIADTLQEWFEGGLADGFMIQPAYFPGAFDDFVDLVVPELQRRGLFRREYAGATLRDHLRQNDG